MVEESHNARGGGRAARPLLSDRGSNNDKHSKNVTWAFPNRGFALQGSGSRHSQFGVESSHRLNAQRKHVRMLSSFVSPGRSQCTLKPPLSEAALRLRRSPLAAAMYLKLFALRKKNQISNLVHSNLFDSICGISESLRKSQLLGEERARAAQGLLGLLRLALQRPFPCSSRASWFRGLAEILRGCTEGA